MALDSAVMDVVAMDRVVGHRYNWMKMMATGFGSMLIGTADKGLVKSSRWE